jgi:2'-5' RNA ligase
VRSFCVALIAELAVRFDAAVFEPHVTIYSTAVGSENPEPILEQLLQGRGPYCLLVRALEYSDELTKTLFVQFAPDAELARLSEELRRASAAPSDYELNPHLSLLYKDLDTGTKHQLAASFRLPFDEIAFDRVKAVIVPAEIRSRTEVEAWRVVAERTLTT